MQETSEQGMKSVSNIEAQPSITNSLDDLYTSRVFIRMGRNRITEKIKLLCADVTGNRRKWYFKGDGAAHACAQKFITWAGHLQNQLLEAGAEWERVEIPATNTQERYKRSNLKRRLTHILGADATDQSEDANGSA